MTRRRTIARRYESCGSSIVTYRQEPGLWYVVRPDSLGRLRRAILPPFRSLPAAIVEAYHLPPRAQTMHHCCGAIVDNTRPTWTLCHRPADHTGRHSDEWPRA